METTKEERERCLADADRWDASVFGQDLVPLSARDKDFGVAMAFARALCRDVDALEKALGCGQFMWRTLPGPAGQESEWLGPYEAGQLEDLPEGETQFWLVLSWEEARVVLAESATPAATG